MVSLNAHRILCLASLLVAPLAVAPAAPSTAAALAAPTVRAGPLVWGVRAAPPAAHGRPARPHAQQPDAFVMSPGHPPTATAAATPPPPGAAAARLGGAALAAAAVWRLLRWAGRRRGAATPLWGAAPAMAGMAGIVVSNPDNEAPWPWPDAESNVCTCVRLGTMKQLIYETTDPDPDSTPHRALPELAITTLNIHAPIHKRIANGQRESSDEKLYLGRNARILELLLKDPPTIICMQEFWLCSDVLTSLYQAALGPAGYHMYITPRTNCRGDGLLTMVSATRLTVLEHRHVAYQECGDRVAHLLRLQAKGALPGQEEFLLMNTHLMFPHDNDSHLIRLRQCAKLLAFVYEYTTQSNLTHLPLVICGDWNGESDGCVYRFMREQGFVSVYDECHKGDTRWVSHLNHRKEAVGVDYVWLLNPSRHRGTLAANWRQLACGCIVAELAALGVTTQEDAYAFFAPKGREYFTPAEFVEGVQRLRITEQEGIGLTKAEIEELAEYMDTNGDGIIDREEIRHTLDMDCGVQMLEEAQGDVKEFVMLYANRHAQYQMPTPWRPTDVEIVSASLPESFANGVWPAGFEQEFSDHAPLSAVLRLPKPHASRLARSKGQKVGAVR